MLAQPLLLILQLLANSAWLRSILLSFQYIFEPFLPSKKLKKSDSSIVSITKALTEFFGKRLLSDIDSGLIEKYIQTRIEEKTCRGTKRSPLRVNKELQALSSSGN